MLGNERAVFSEDLDTIIGAVADIDEAVLVETDAVYGIAELLGRRFRWIVRRRFLIAWLLAVSTPMALVSAGFRIKHRDPSIGIAVGSKHLFGGGVDRDIGRRAKPFGRIAIIASARLADLQHKLTVHGELEKLAIRLAAAGKPDKVVVVYEDTVLRLRPLIAG